MSEKTAPRASRRGAKISGASQSPEREPSPGAEATDATNQTPSKNSVGDSPSARLPTPPSLLPFSEGSGSLLDFSSDPSATATTSGVATGVVRSRGASVPVTTVKSTEDKPTVEAKLSERIGKVQSNVKKPHVVSTDSAPLHALARCDVLVTTELNGILIPAKLAAQQQQGDIIVATTSKELDKLQSQLCQKLGAAAVQKWDSNECDVSKSDAKVKVTNDTTLLVYLLSAKDRETMLGNVTHIILTTGQSFHKLTWEALLKSLKHLIVSVVPDKRPKIAVCAMMVDVVALTKFFPPLDVWNVESEAVGPIKADVSEFSCEEVSAVSDIPIVRLESSSSSSAALVEPPAKATTNAVKMATYLINRLYTPATKSLTTVIYVGDIGEVINSLKSSSALKGVEDVHILTHIPSYPALFPDSRHEKHPTLPQKTILVLSHAISEEDAAVIGASVVIDLGSQKAWCSVNKAECALLTKRTEYASQEEAAARRRTLGWAGTAIYFALYATEDAKRFQERKQSVTSTAEFEGVTLAMSRFSLDSGRECQSLIHVKPSGDVREHTMHWLAEQCCIVSPENPGLTFVGEIISRVQLPAESAFLVLYGLIVGLEHLAAITAAVASSPIRQNCPTTPGTPATQSSWIHDSIDSMNKYTSGHCSDILADVAVFIEWLKIGPAEDLRKEFCFAHVVDESVMEDTQHVVGSILAHTSDYRTHAPQSPAALATQLERYASVLEYFIVASFCRKTCIVRNDGKMSNAMATAHPLFIKTQKEVSPNSFRPRTVEWKMGNMVVPTSIMNTTTQKMFASDCTVVHPSYFSAAMVLLFPCVEFARAVYQEEESIFFSLVINRQLRRFRTDLATGAKIMDFREQLNLALGCVQVKRAMPADAPLSVLHSALSSPASGRTDVDELRKNLLSTLDSLVHDSEVKESQAYVSNEGKVGDHKLAPVPPAGALPATIAEASDILLAHIIAGSTQHEPHFPLRTSSDITGDEGAAASATKSGAKAHAAAAATGQGEEATATTTGGSVFIDDDDELEVEGESAFLKHGPLIEEDE